MEKQRSSNAYWRTYLESSFDCASISFFIEWLLLMVINSKNEMLDDLSLFISIVRAGSLNMASEQQNIPAATLTRRLKKWLYGISSVFNNSMI
ncbi:hypothetical protein [Acinetobacter bereziniae]|uniref:hypothetical protein n=1 Tax=Acinetobacter bereziniae TaxID=106648 RepID=UPI00215CF9E9|nr:hypothetical protein [Acinetobacter bereziniae]